MKKLVVALVAVAAGVSACGSSSNVSYQPLAWGPAGYCYYLYSPYECYGHHPGVPFAMPLYWHSRYAAYYDSPAYIGTYVPRSYRSTATARSRVFERTYASSIKAQARSATWKGSNGKVVSGTKVGRSATYGSGGARSKGFSSGSRVNSSGSPCASVSNHVLLASVGNHALFARGGSSSGGGGGGRSSGSSGGGSRSSGSGSYGGGSSRGKSGTGGSQSGKRSGRSC